MIGYADAKDILLNKYETSKVTAIYNGGSFWLFAIKPAQMKPSEYVLDGYFAVDKNTGKISEYAAFKNPDEYRKARENVIYKEKS